MYEVITKVIRGDMGECSEFNGYTEYFTCMLLMCNICYLMDKVFDQRSFVHIRYIFQNLPRILLARSFTEWVISRLFYFSDIPCISVVNRYGYLVLHVSQLPAPTSQLPKIVRYLLQNISLQCRKQ